MSCYLFDPDKCWCIVVCILLIGILIGIVIGCWLCGKGKNPVKIFTIFAAFCTIFFLPMYFLVQSGKDINGWNALVASFLVCLFMWIYNNSNKKDKE